MVLVALLSGEVGLFGEKNQKKFLYMFRFIAFDYILYTVIYLYMVYMYDLCLLNYTHKTSYHWIFCPKGGLRPPIISNVPPSGTSSKPSTADDQTESGEARPNSASEKFTKKLLSVALVDHKNLVGGFKDVLFSPLFGEDSQFD